MAALHASPPPPPLRRRGGDPRPDAAPPRVTLGRLRTRRSAPPPSAPRSLVRHVWGEVRRMREPVAAAGGGEDVDEVACGAIRRDVADDVAWARPSAELSDAVLRIERLIFKDLVADTIRCLADVASLPRAHLPRRRLVFP
uniref:DUF4378 domain-containing protein n=1 Tax=Ananas comosus var. bracteatus TaxID=296719 RepID=A0A6V7NVY4_ANACO|nr:unnamed protein product [Ananas comosus var. bracteatus]